MLFGSSVVAVRRALHVALVTALPLCALGCAHAADVHRSEIDPALVAQARAHVIASGLLDPRAEIVVAASLAEFATLTGRSEPALRAWTTYDRVTLAPLSTWRDSSPAAVERRITHELCHAAIEQSFGARAAAERARIPRFFEEGACSVLAGDERIPLEQVRARLVAGSRDVNPAVAMPLAVEQFTRDPELAYAASHHFIAALAQAHGGDLVPRVLALAVSDGAPGCVERALAATIDRDIVSAWRSVLAGEIDAEFARGGGA